MNRRTTEPSGPAPAPGCDESASGCQADPSVRALGSRQPVIPGVPVIRRAGAIPHRAPGSLGPTCVSVRPVGLTVGRASTRAPAANPARIRRQPAVCAPPLLFGGYPPQITHPPCRVRPNRMRVRHNGSREWYFTIGTAALPPVLGSQPMVPVQSCGKGARGLTVRPWAIRILTGLSISLGPCWRRRGSRYTLRAGRYLCDSEFRYLGTVGVTAAVCREFEGAGSRHLPSSPSSAGQVSDSIRRLRFAESCVFNKQSPPPAAVPLRGPVSRVDPLIPRLRGHFAEFLQHGSHAPRCHRDHK